MTVYQILKAATFVNHEWEIFLALLEINIIRFLIVIIFFNLPKVRVIPEESENYARCGYGLLLSIRVCVEQFFFIIIMHWVSLSKDQASVYGTDQLWVKNLLMVPTQ